MAVEPRSTRPQDKKRAMRSARRQQNARQAGDQLYWLWSGCYGRTSFLAAGWPYPETHPGLVGGPKPWR